MFCIDFTNTIKNNFFFDYILKKLIYAMYRQFIINIVLFVYEKTVIEYFTRYIMFVKLINVVVLSLELLLLVAVWITNSIVLVFYLLA